MDEAVYLVVDYEGVCRLCLQGRGALSELFGEPAAARGDAGDEGDGGGPQEPQGPAPPLAAQIRALTGVRMSEGDGLPGKICHRCRYVVEAGYELRTTVVRSNRLLLASVEAQELIAEAYRRPDEGHDEDAPSPHSSQSPHSPPTPDEIVEETTVECKIEREDPSEARADYTDYTSSREVTLEEVKFDEPAPRVSDEGGSDGPSRGGAARERHHACQLCLEPFSDRTRLVEHVRDHYKDSPLIPYPNATKPFACQECHHTFLFKIDLIAHHRKHLDINPYTCKVSGCTFDIRSREALRHHMYTHALKKYICNRCGARYRRKVEILRHQVRHQDEGHQFRCGICLVICKNRLSLKAHLKNHEIGRRFKCEFPGCPKAFYSNSDLVIHSRSHSNDKCFKCPLCVCAYTSQSQLNRHLRRHDKPGPTKCDKCSEVFEDYGSFCNHRIATHGEWQPHRCKGCNQGYQSELQLEKHLNRCEIAQKMKELGVDNLSMIIEDKSNYMDQSGMYK